MHLIVIKIYLSRRRRIIVFFTQTVRNYSCHSSSGSDNLLGCSSGLLLLGRLAVGKGVATAATGLAGGGTGRRAARHGRDDELVLALGQAEEEVEDEILGPLLAEHGGEESGGRIALGRVGVVGLLAVEDGLLGFQRVVGLGRLEQVDVGRHVLLEGGEEVVVHDALVLEAREEHLLGEELRLVVELGRHPALEAVVLVLDGLEQMLVGLGVIGLLVVEGLEVDDGQVLLAVEGQQVDAQHGEVVARVGIPHRVEHLRVVAGVVVGHANLAILVGGVAVVDDAGLLVLVDVDAEVDAGVGGAVLDGPEVGEGLRHEVHLPLPEGHVQEGILVVGPADGVVPRHAVRHLRLLEGDGGLGLGQQTLDGDLVQTELGFERETGLDVNGISFCIPPSGGGRRRCMFARCLRKRSDERVRSRGWDAALSDECRSRQKQRGAGDQSSLQSGHGCLD